MIKYIHNNNINITNDSLIYNKHTWEGSTAYQLDSIEYFFSLIKNQKDFCVLDIGAQSGCFSLMAKFCEETTWYAFEPDPINYTCLVENLSLNNIKNVITSKVGISNVNGTSTFNICSTHRGLNTLGTDLKRFTESESEKLIIETKTLDDLFNNKKIDLIKIDTEGCEFNILIGAKNIIKKYKPKIFLEYYDINLRQFGYTIDDLNKLINDIDYKITWIKDDNALIESK